MKPFETIPIKDLPQSLQMISDLALSHGATVLAVKNRWKYRILRADFADDLKALEMTMIDVIGSPPAVSVSSKAIGSTVLFWLHRF